MIKEYRVEWKHGTQGHYVIADSPLQAIRNVIAQTPHFKRYKVSDFKAVLWKKGKTIYTIKRVNF